MVLQDVENSKIPFKMVKAKLDTVAFNIVLVWSLSFAVYPSQLPLLHKYDQTGGNHFTFPQWSENATMS